MLLVQPAVLGFWPPFGQYRWADETVRVSHQAKRASIERRKRRQLLEVEGSGPSEYTVGGVDMDYSSLDCPAEWVDLLDSDPDTAACLPWQELLNPTVGADFKTPLGVGMRDAGDPYGYAAPDPFGADPICTTGTIEDCKYSTPETRDLPDFLTTTKEMPDPITTGWGAANDPATRSYPTLTGGECTKDDSATQWLDCGIPCPAPFEMTTKDLQISFGTPVIIFVALCTVLGLVALKKVGGKAENYFVAGRSLSLPVLAATLAGQGIDGSGTMGNVDLAYNYHFWDGFALPFGIGWSLVLVGIFFAKPLNDMKLLTLPDVFGRRFGPASEVAFGVFAIVSFICLFGSNLVGFGKVIAYVFGLGSPYAGICIAGCTVWVYTVAGGMLSVAYTDIVQGCFGYLGLLVGTAYVYHNFPRAPGVSPAYPLGDKNAIPEGMSDPDSYDPIPNAIFFNWVTIIVLALGNVAAIDFQARVLAAKDGTTARRGCFIAAALVFLIGGFTSANGGAIRALYGPSSPHAEFVADSCSRYITVVGCFGPDSCNAVPLPGVPTCGEWKPDPFAPLKMITCTKDTCNYFLDFDGSGGFGAGSETNHPMNGFLGGWMLIAIVAACMSTGDGSILAMGTVFSYNILRRFAPFEQSKLLRITRISTVFWTALSIGIACAVPDQTGYLLIVAFDIMLAGSVIPLFAAVYWPSCKPIAAFASIMAGSFSRLILEFALPKDRLLLLLGDYAQTYGAGIYDPNMLNVFLGLADGNIDDVCPQSKLADYSGVDSLVAPAVCGLTLILFQLLPCVPTESKSWWFTKVEPVEFVEGGGKTTEAEAGRGIETEAA